MTNPFEQLETYLVNATGMDALFAGLVLAMILTIPLIIMFVWILDPKGHDSGPAIMIGGAIGIMFSTVVGWLDLWVVVFIVFIIVFIIVDPLSLRKSSAT